MGDEVDLVGSGCFFDSFDVASEFARRAIDVGVAVGAREERWQSAATAVVEAPHAVARGFEGDGVLGPVFGVAGGAVHVQHGCGFVGGGDARGVVKDVAGVGRGGGGHWRTGERRGQ